MRGILVLLLALVLAGCLQETSGPPSTSTPASTWTGTTTAQTPIPVLAPIDSSPTTPDWRDVACNLPQVWAAVQTPTPDLIVLHGRNGITRYDLGENGTASAIASGGQGPKFVAVVNKTIVTADLDPSGWHLVARHSDLRVRTQTPVPTVTAMAAADGILYVATRWNLTAYDEELNLVGRVDLQIPHGGTLLKAVDAVRIAGGHAYLLDDAAAPFVVFRVDVRNPAAMRVVLVLDLSSSSTPQLQWLNETSGTWYVEQNQMGLSENAVAVTPVDIETGAAGPAIPIQSRTFPIRPNDPTPNEGFGRGVFSTTFTLPAWAITYNATGVDMAHIDVRGTAIERSCMVPMTDLTLLQHADLLVTYGGEHVTVWEARDQLRLRSEHRLPAAPAGQVALFPG